MHDQLLRKVQMSPSSNYVSLNLQVGVQNHHKGIEWRGQTPQSSTETYQQIFESKGHWTQENCHFLNVQCILDFIQIPVMNHYIAWPTTMEVKDMTLSSNTVHQWIWELGEQGMCHNLNVLFTQTENFEWTVLLVEVVTAQAILGKLCALVSSSHSRYPKLCHNTSYLLWANTFLFLLPNILHIGGHYNLNAP